MPLFAQASEKDVTKTIVSEFTKEFLEHIESDAIIVGGGPSGLVAAKKLGEAGKKTVVIESNNYLGGGFWIGGYLMNKLTVRAPAQRILDEIGAPYKQAQKGLYVADGPHACSKLVAACCDAGAKIINCTRFEDVVLKNDAVSGAVINWNAVSALPRAITCVDPVAIESKIVIDATGHDAVVARKMQEHGKLSVMGCGGMNVEESEDLLVEKTGLIHPGLIVTGMAVSAFHGLPRMGPTFGGMLLSGEKAAETAIKELL